MQNKKLFENSFAIKVRLSPQSWKGNQNRPVTGKGWTAT